MCAQTFPMKYTLTLFTLFITFISGFTQNIKISDPVHFLALGDSYTIGQSVAAGDSWPSQFAFALSYKGFNVQEVKIIAQTGWRTDNLINAIIQQQPLTGYNLVSLLIGVNNQYQGRSIEMYTTEFEDLLKTAIKLAGDYPEHVFVLSIPDYAYTPYGKGNPSISAQIDQFNTVNRQITEKYHVKYIDITPVSRSGLSQPDLIASDGLHPSRKMYALWVQEILKYTEKQLGLDAESFANNAITCTLYQKQLLVKTGIKLAELLIYNTNGKLVMAQKLQSDTDFAVNLGNLHAAMYLLQFRSNKKVVYTTKIVLQ